MAVKKTYIFRNGKAIEVERVRQEPKAPMIMVDTMSRPEYCHATGKYYTSRSERRMDLKMANVDSCSWDSKFGRSEPDYSKEIEQDILIAQNDLRWNQSGELTEKDRVDCKIINDNLFKKE